MGEGYTCWVGRITNLVDGNIFEVFEVHTSAYNSPLGMAYISKNWDNEALAGGWFKIPHEKTKYFGKKGYKDFTMDNYIDDVFKINIFPKVNNDTNEAKAIYELIIKCDIKT